MSVISTPHDASANGFSPATLYRLSVQRIVNLIDRRIQVYTDPTGSVDPPGYGRRQACGPNDDVPVVVDGHEVGRIRVGALLL